jgi:hypothetical protein
MYEQPDANPAENKHSKAGSETLQYILNSVFLQQGSQFQSFKSDNSVTNLMHCARYSTVLQVNFKKNILPSCNAHKKCTLPIKLKKEMWIWDFILNHYAVQGAKREMGRAASILS